MFEEIEIGSYTMDIRIRIRKNKEPVYGAGVSLLLQKTDQLNSLRAAAEEIGMPYKKALAVVSRAEKELNRQLLVRTIGGAGGGGSNLTEFGKRLVYDFKEFEESINKFAQDQAKNMLFFSEEE